MSKLYIIPTPIGNLRDITHRALEILGSCDAILAEDTRKTSILLKQYGISKPLFAHHKFNEHRTLKPMVDRIRSGDVLALVSDAGTPGISDPGFLIVRECIREGLEVETLPGPTAFIPALINSGFPADRFCFEGFLPQKKGRMKKLEELKTESRTMIFYESPFRLSKTLLQLAAVMGGGREASVSRELSKIHEETLRDSLENLALHFEKHPPRGEIVIVVKGLGNQNT
jgi:16S rRNA (cytidine1402-2'-O)-methyltransferase